MGRTPLAVAGLIGLLAVGCAAGPIEIAVAPLDSEAPVEDLPFDDQDSTPTPDDAPQDAIDPFAAILVVDIESGVVFDGTYVPEFNGPAMNWTVLADIDPDAGYARVSIGGVAEPGDRGCIEAIEASGGVFVRDSFDTGRMAAFAGDPDSASLLDAYASGLPRLAADVSAAHGSEPWATSPTGDGGIQSTVVLSAEGVAAVRNLLVDPGGIDTLYDSGTLVTVEDANGSLMSLSLDAIAEPEGRRETLDLDLSYVEPQAKINVDSPWAPNAGCPSAAVDLSGGWKVTGIGTSAVSDLPAMGGATVLFGADGAFSGTTGCQAFSGHADFGFSWFENAEISATGDPCEGIEGVLEESLIAALTGEAELAFDGDGHLVLAATDQVVVLAPL